MTDSGVDILMVTYRRPEYTRLALERLLETCDESMRVWIWHNGNNEETLEVVRSLIDHPFVYEFYHSQENKKLREPTNWFWTHAKGDYLGKVDDDCLVPNGWADTLRKAHVDVPEFGVIGCWRFLESDFIPEHAHKKIKRFTSVHQIMQNCWIEGSGYLMKRSCLEANGLLRRKESFTRYCIRLARKGWINGWYYPFLYQEHMDDPRSVHTLLKTDADIELFTPLTAKNFDIKTVEDWLQYLRRDAYINQTASTNPKYYIGWRSKFGRLFRKCMGNRFCFI